MNLNPTQLRRDFKIGQEMPVASLRHVAQFYDQDAFLIKCVSRFVSEGLRAGDGVMLIATKAHIKQLRAEFARDGVSYYRQETDGQLVFVEAELVLSHLIVDGLPDERRFNGLFQRTVAELAARHGRVRVFGELVDILWREGNHAATLYLEKLWSRLQEAQPLTLYCGYCMETFGQAEHVQGFADVCDLHSLVIPSEIFSEARSTAEQLRLVASLQQQAIALRNEVNDRIKVERTMRHNEERLRLAFQTAGMGSWTLDLLTDDVVFSVEQGRLFGLAPHELKGKLSQFIDLIIPEDQERMMTTLMAAIAGKDARYENHYRIRRRDGEVRSINARGRIERDANNRATMMFGVVIDVTSQRQAEEELRQAKVDAEAANSSKSAFLANMSHELRTPLGAILGFSELIQDESLTADQLRSFISVIMRNGRELAALVDDILDLSKVEAGQIEIEPRTIGIATFLSDIATSLGAKAREKGIKLQLTTDSRVPDTIVSDPTRLRQILINVIGNAVKFTSAGHVSVHVKCGPPSPDGRPTIKFLVQDTGCGISEEGRLRIFKPFSQADNSTTRRFGGTGLGLALSRKLADKLGGEVTLVESVVGRGSVFAVTVVSGMAAVPSQTALDLANSGNVNVNDVRAEARTPRSPAPKERPLEGIRILLAEDVPDNQLLILHVLKNSGATIDVVDNGAAALSRGSSGNYDVILMDIQMPIMDGLDATRKLRARGFTKPIIALTAHALIEERDRCLSAGCDDHLTKPFSYKDLLFIVSKNTAKQRIK